MYFRSRAEAGRKLADKLEHYKGRKVTVVALSPGSALVAAQIAMRLRGLMVMLVVESEPVAGEYETMADTGPANNLTFDHMLNSDDVEEQSGQGHQLEDERRLKHFQKPHVLMGSDGKVHPEYLRDHTVIIVSDGLANGVAINVANEFLKTITMDTIVIAAPIASVAAIDQVHPVADEICCLDIVEAYISTSHYYDDNTLPNSGELSRITKNISARAKN